MNITKCPAPFDNYGYDEMGALFKKTRIFSYPWRRLKPSHFFLTGGMYYKVKKENVLYSFNSEKKVFKEVGK